jgi:hypothetical protein
MGQKRSAIMHHALKQAAIAAVATFLTAMMEDFSDV